MTTTYRSKEEVLSKALTILHKTLRQVISPEAVRLIEKGLRVESKRLKGHLGGSVERYFFDINPGNLSEPDFRPVNVELKTTPLKSDSRRNYTSKERLVFSMIDYRGVINESWENSTFLKKNRTLLLMFYLWMEKQTFLDYKFLFIDLLDILKDLPPEDRVQIQRDWEYIISKIRRGEAHLLSEGDTYLLGACAKAADSSIVRQQATSEIPAKPRAFSFKQQYMNHLVQTKLLGLNLKTDSIFKKQRRIVSIDETIRSKFAPFIGKTDRMILNTLGYQLGKTAKNYKRLIVNRILDVTSNRIEEFIKANIILRVVTLEHNSNLRESISFPAFDYVDLINQTWYDPETGTMSEFHSQLESNKFLFVIFQKQKGDDDIVLKKVLFWNFPMTDLGEAQRVWETTVSCVKEGKYSELPRIRDSVVAHVRPHGKNSKDTIETPQHTQEIKRSFWLNAKYIQAIVNQST